METTYTFDRTPDGGVLAITTSRGIKPTTSTITYYVESTRNQHGACMGALLLNSTSGEVYEVVLSPDQQHASCSCLGFTRHKRCKHSRTIVEINATALLDCEEAIHAEICAARS